MVRKLQFTEPTIGLWSAVDALVEKQYHDGSFEDTIAVFDWPDEPTSISLGCHEDGDMMNATIARDRGYVPGRRYIAGGSVGVYGQGIPLFMLYFDDTEGDLTLDLLSRTVGEATADVIDGFGLEAVYDHIGDVKVETDEGTFKVAANAPAKFADTDLWATTVSIIWGMPPEGTQDILDDAVRVPPEKFEDKETKTVTGRMSPLSQEFEKSDISASKQRVIDATIEGTVNALYGDVPVESRELDAAESAFIDSLTPFFESDLWINRVATSKLCTDRSGDERIGVAAYKSRKLVKASIVVADGRIEDALITGDFFARPHPTVTARGATRDIEGAIVGLDPDDTDALTSAIETVVGAENFESPGVDPADFVSAISHAAENTQPIADYLEEYT